MEMDFWSWVSFIAQEYGHLFLQGAAIAVFLAVAGTFLGTVIGCAGCLVSTLASFSYERSARKHVLSCLAWLTSFYVWLFRGTPMMVQAVVIYYGASALFQWDLNPLAAGLFVVSLNTGAYMVETMRGGISSVDSGQMDGADALGMSRFQAMRLVILPQAFRSVIPQIGNFLVSNVKETSVLSIITVNELFYSGREAAGNYFRYFETFFIICVIYLILTTILSFLLQRLERRLKKMPSAR